MALFAAGLVGRWYLFVRPLPFKSDRVEFRVPPGSSVRSIAQAAQAAGIELNADAMVAAARFAGSTQSLRAGRYSVERGITLSGLLAKLQAGDVIRERLTVVEGIAFREMRALLSAQTELKQDSAHMSAEELLKAIGASETHPEGLFAPETYVYDPGISDLEIYRQAYRAQMKLLQGVGCPQSRSAVRQPVRGADHGVDHREGDWASVGASDDCRCVRQPVKTGYVAANRSFGHLRNGRRIRREPAQARSARRRTLQLVYTSWLPPTPIALPGRLDRSGAAPGKHVGAVLRVARRWHFSLFGNAGRTQSCGRHLSAVLPPMSARGRFITFEGIDGSGKSTHIDAVAGRCAHAA